MNDKSWLVVAMVIPPMILWNYVVVCLHMTAGAWGRTCFLTLLTNALTKLGDTLLFGTRDSNNHLLRPYSV